MRYPHMSPETEIIRYEQIVFMQEHNAHEAMDILDHEGPEAAIKHLMQWHCPGDHETTRHSSAGSMDNVYELDGYILTWNTGLPYIGLEFMNVE